MSTITFACAHTTMHHSKSPPTPGNEASQSPSPKAGSPSAYRKYRLKVNFRGTIAHVAWFKGASTTPDSISVLLCNAFGIPIDFKSSLRLRDSSGDLLPIDQGAALAREVFLECDDDFVSPKVNIEHRNVHDMGVSQASGDTMVNSLPYGKVAELLNMTKFIAAEMKEVEAVDHIVRSTASILGADRVTLFFVDRQANELTIACSKSQLVVEDSLHHGLRDICIPLDKQSIAGYVAITGEIANVEDPYSDPRFDRTVDQETRYKTYSILCVPVQFKDLGAVAVLQAINKIGDRGELDTTRSFDSVDEILIRHMADFAGSVLQKVRLVGSLRQEKKHALSLLRITQSLGESPDSPKVIATIVDEAYEMLQADRITIFMVHKNDSQLEIVYSGDAIGMRVSMGKGIAGHVANTGRIVNIADAYNDPRFDPSADKDTGYKTESILCAPIKDLHGEVIAVIQALNKLTYAVHVDISDEEEDVLMQERGSPPSKLPADSPRKNRRRGSINSSHSRRNSSAAETGSEVAYSGAVSLSSSRNLVVPRTRSAKLLRKNSRSLSFEDKRLYAAFSDTDLDNLEIIAEAAGVHLRNAILFEREQRAVRVKECLLRIVHTITKSKSEPRAFIRDVSREVCGILHSETADIFFVNQDKRQLVSFTPSQIMSEPAHKMAGDASEPMDNMRRAKSSRTVFSASNEGSTRSFDMGIDSLVARVALTGESISIKDAGTDSMFNPEVDEEILGKGTKSLLCMPVYNSSQTRILAVMVVRNKRPPTAIFSLLKVRSRMWPTSRKSSPGSACFSSSDEEALSAVCMEVKTGIRNILDATITLKLDVINMNESMLLSQYHEESSWRSISRTHSLAAHSSSGGTTTEELIMDDIITEAEADAEARRGSAQSLVTVHTGTDAMESSHRSKRPSWEGENVWTSNLISGTDFSTIKSWNLDFLGEHGDVVETWAHRILTHDIGLLQRFQIGPKSLHRFVRTVRQNYRETNPFHNFRHAVSVLHGSWMFLNKNSELENVLNSAEKLSILLASFCHDLDHPGTTPLYQVNACTELALRYTPDATLERHHCYKAFSIMLRSESGDSLLGNLQSSSKVFEHVRKTIIACILGTDMKKHFNHIKDLSKRIDEAEKRLHQTHFPPMPSSPQEKLDGRLKSKDSARSEPLSAKTRRRGSSIHSHHVSLGSRLSLTRKTDLTVKIEEELISRRITRSHTERKGFGTPGRSPAASRVKKNLSRTASHRNIASSQTTMSPNRTRGASLFKSGSDAFLKELFDVSSDDDRISLSTLIVHTADLIGQTLPLKLAEGWGRAIMEEFETQAELERASDFEVSVPTTSCDLDFYKSQYFFTDHIVKPLWSKVLVVFPKMEDVYDELNENIDHFKGMCEMLKKPDESESDAEATTGGTPSRQR